MLLVLLHDFPEFLCDYHFSFCDVIPPNCIQMRNLILSAFPRNMRLPDPFTPNLKVLFVENFIFCLLERFQSVVIRYQPTQLKGGKIFIIIEATIKGDWGLRII